MKKTLVAALTVLIAVVAFGKTTKVKPKLTKAQAQTIALTKAKGGVVESAELEKEKGHLVWSFDIHMAAKDITEVLVDANDGSIVDVQHENIAAEKAEKAKEKKH